MKKIPTIIVAAAATGGLLLSLCACGGQPASQDETSQSTATESAQEDAEEATSADETVIDYDTAIDNVFAVCPITTTQAKDIKVADKSGIYIITFGSDFGDFSYTVDAKTGEITEKTEPEVPVNVEDADPAELALDACFDRVGYTGGAENIHVKLASGGKIINVQFDWNGTHYDMDYDVDTQTITEN